MWCIVSRYSLNDFLLIVQKAQAITDIADKMDEVIIDLSLTIQNIRMIEDFSNVHLNEVRIAAIYLSTAIMDCLTGLVKWLNASSISTFLTALMLVLKQTYMTPDFDKKLTIVHTRSGLYAIALQSKIVREKQHDDILEWICPASTKYISPKSRKETGDTCHWFFDSPEYLLIFYEDKRLWIVRNNIVVNCSLLLYMCRSERKEDRTVTV